MISFFVSLLSCFKKQEDEPEAAPPAPSAPRRVRRVLGEPLKETIRDGESEPFWLRYITETISTQTIGLFRVPGNQRRITKIVDSFSKDGTILENDGSFTDADFCTSLKRLLRFLPEPLISRHIHDALLDIAYDFSQTSGNTVIFEKMTATLAKLAEAEKTTLEALIGFLRSVAGDAETNLMTVENLGLVLGPTLMKLPEPMTTDPAERIEYDLQKDVLEMILSSNWPEQESDSETEYYEASSYASTYATCSEGDSSLFF
ncbi:unnamed protein product [Oikopleura dioica]|uniref:Gem-interacting protein Graf2-like protein n=1 Tax=Oikopleura dioica TaxID=34765 RepID=Q66S53_OIKDI|nr:Gem-interacting protein Graf2-like protein [Oikopleura dioica]CBY16248.1 unnamed protein product [Oikopleura dioica]